MMCFLRYSPLDPVKRPGSGEKVYDVLRKMNPDISYAEEKDPGAWTTKIVQFEPEKSIVRPFDTLRNRLREEKKLPPMPERGVGHRKEYWGNIVTHYKVGQQHTVLRFSLVSQHILRVSFEASGSNEQPLPEKTRMSSSLLNT